MSSPDKSTRVIAPGASPPSAQKPTWIFVSRRQPALFLDGETIPLASDREYIIGRDAETCNIVINDERVSRQHASIYSRGGRYFVRDHGSMNGTFVNREKIVDALGLLPGDEIFVPPQKVLFVLHDQYMRSAGGQMKQSHFSGLLRALRIPDLIQMLNSTMQTGTLMIMDTNGQTGRTLFMKGEIIAAQYKDKREEDAVYALVGVPDGQFEFITETAPTWARSIETRTITLLLEACRRLDEQKQENSTPALAG